MAFNPQDHIRKISGKDYLDIVWRVKWFRDVYPKNALVTELLATDGSIIFKATIFHDDGSVWATGHGSAPSFGHGQGTWKGREIEKAETAAIGRALKNIGFGTEYAFDDEDSDGDYLADAPVERKQAPKAPLSTVWNKTEQEQFWSLWNGEKKLVKDSILAALKVGKLSDFKGTLEQANTAMEMYIKKAS